MWNAVDQYSYPGSAETVTTVIASDHTGTYTIQHENLWSNSWDVSYRHGLGRVLDPCPSWQRTPTASSIRASSPWT